MKKILTRLSCLFLFSLLTTGNMNAQFTISGEFRPRAEYRNGYYKLGDSTMTGYGTILGRSRINFEYSSEKIQTRFIIQHAFVFGENNYGSDTITKNTINIYEGWLKYNFTKNFGVRIGRMGLTYDDSRIFGLSNWSQMGATHDIVNLEWKVPGAKYTGDYGFAINNAAPASMPYLGDYTLKNYKYMSYLYNQVKFLKEKLVVSVMGVVDAYQMANTTATIPGKTIVTWVTNGTDTVGSFTTKTSATTVTTTHNLTIYARETAGATIGFNWKNLNVFGNGYYQMGKYKDGRNVSAYFWGGWISYRVVKPLTLLIGYEQTSGNNASDTTDFKANVHGFATPFATKHSFYGYMDLYSSYLGQDALHNGLNDLYGRATVKFSDKVSLEGTYRWFTLPYGYLPTKTKEKFQSVSTNLGSEIDLMVLYKPIPNLELNAAYCVYLQNDTKEIMDGLKAGTGRTGQYAYVMVTYKPNFFTSEKK
ncbi:MAG: alginate export family protein [Bacteroidetes bacterium]|nr:alginate export family protein [Bacteroidota bacterium]